ncbi:porphobilinogen deaminase [Pseudomassariella vexata]|uniref:Porphobilinogen deaminase n=1 Tax=Pseudomassariella vexata TaxID=1141098 RepID=A0A1Y2EL92_9PEZI|nr:porphobilinogen deaminase [Pseudomassariella vexata]ORY72046.1 porphobilinogen deaminase [Pseudomassariella vexata]
MSTSATQPVITPSDSKSTTIRVGTRKSALALKQADFVVTSLQRLHPTINFEIKGMHSAADKDKVTALYKFGGKGLWTNELEAELMGGELDMIVHSLKDMPTGLPEGCVLACVTQREDPRDVVVVKKSLEEKYKTLADLPEGSVVGTSSVRRMAQVRRRYPGLEFKDMRGNIDTRLKKLDAEDSEYSVLILAAAGLSRMGLTGRVSQYLESGTKGGGMLHAVGQGGLGIEARADDEKTLELLKALENKEAMLAAEAERSVMRTLEGGCSIPIGVETQWVSENKLRMTATVVSVDGTEGADAEHETEVKTREEAVEFGLKIAKQLTENGAQKILDVINAARAANPNTEKWVPA